MDKDEALKLALDDLIAEYHMETSSFAKRVDEIFKQALAAPTVQEPSYETLWHKVWPDAGSFVRASADDLRKFASSVATPPAQPAPVQDDLPDFIAGAFGVSRGTAYDMMREALKDAAPVPDKITDNSESPEYKAGWNECRELMLSWRKP